MPHGESDEETSWKVRTISRRIVAGGLKLIREVLMGDMHVVRRGRDDRRNYLASPAELGPVSRMQRSEEPDLNAGGSGRAPRTDPD